MNELFEWWWLALLAVAIVWYVIIAADPTRYKDKDG